MRVFFLFFFFFFLLFFFSFLFSFLFFSFFLSLRPLLPTRYRLTSSGIYHPIDTLCPFDQAPETYDSALIALHKSESVLRTPQISIGRAHSLVRVANPVLNNITVRISRSVAEENLSGGLATVIIREAYAEVDVILTADCTLAAFFLGIGQTLSAWNSGLSCGERPPLRRSFGGRIRGLRGRGD